MMCCYDMGPVAGNPLPWWWYGLVILIPGVICLLALALTRQCRRL